MEDLLFLQHGNILRVRVLEKTDKKLKLEVVERIEGHVEKGTVFEVAIPPKDIQSLLGDEQYERYVLI